MILAVLAGCGPQEPFFVSQHHPDEDLAYYQGAATKIEYPDVEAERLADVACAKRPWTLQNRDTRDIWELTLEQSMEIALKNNKVMRNIGGSVQGPPDFILRNPEAAPTIYDPAIAESSPRGGVEGALADFDAKFNTSLTWERTNTPENVSPVFVQEGIFADISEHDLGTFQAQLSKVAATGGQFSLTSTVASDLDRFQYGVQAPYAYAQDWNVKLVAEVRQPLLQGAGTQFNRIAGPGGQVGQYNGVMIARINTDIALANFEEAVRNLVSDVETAYWELYFEYRSLDAVIAGRDSALTTWRKIYTLYLEGAKGGEAEKEAQARAQYFLFRSTAENSLNSLYVTEAKFRYMLGLAATDGRLIRPKDEPTTAKVSFDWHEVLNEGLARSVELREQKWIVKRRELELIAAKNFLLPRLDLVAQYRWLGLGNDLFAVPGGAGADIQSPGSNAIDALLDGQFQEWQIGFQGQIPIGYRRENAGVKNAEQILARENVKLQEGELELSHQLAYAVRDLETNYVLTETNFNRRIAAQRQVEAVALAYEQGTITLDVLLSAQQTLAQAESDYYRKLVDYNKSISQVHYRKGSLLEYNGVYLAEGPWPGKAYFDARRRARARAASKECDYGFTQPRVVSRGPMEQNVGTAGAQQAAPPAQPELVPSPEPNRPSPGPATEPMPAPGRPQTPQPAPQVTGTEPEGAAATSVPIAATPGSPPDRPVVPQGWTSGGEPLQPQP
jgi:outer membrane protein TolC